MNSREEKPESVVTYSEHLALAGLEEQWREGDPLALVEAVTICGRHGEPYPAWVLQVLNMAMTNLYDAVYSTESTTESHRNGGAQNWIRGEDQITWRMDRARDRFLVSLGLSTSRDNAGKIRKRLLRDAHLAELIAERCEFILTPIPKFKGVNQALDDLEIELGSDEEQPDKLRRIPKECWDVKYDTIKRAWKKHKEKLVVCYAQNPNGPSFSLNWFLGFSESEPDQG